MKYPRDLELFRRLKAKRRALAKVARTSRKRNRSKS